MSASQLTYLDSSAIVKLAVLEPESMALREFLLRRQPWVSSALAITEVARALLPYGPRAIQQGRALLARLELVRVTDRVLTQAGDLQPSHLRSLDAIHLATAHQLGAELSTFVTYDVRLAQAAAAAGVPVAAPT